ncbi:MAG: hypothetical protein GTO41_05335 [Burkholderiales bacterium]|nr:hypothetical protein [Burkholderiales bacterium]
MNGEKRAREFLSTGLDDGWPDDSVRVDRAMKQAQRQLAARDLLTLFFGRMWTVLAVLMAPLFGLFLQQGAAARRKPADKSEPSA